MLEPKKVKYRKIQKGRRRGTAHRGSTLAFGEYGLKAVERGWMTAREIEAARVALTRYLKRGGKVWILIFPDKPLTKKPLETRMGKGKGPLELWVAVIQPGRILFEMEGVEEPLARLLEQQGELLLVRRAHLLDFHSPGLRRSRRTRTAWRARCRTRAGSSIAARIATTSRSRSSRPAAAVRPICCRPVPARRQRMSC